MNVRRGGLGRGLGALIPTGPIEDDDEREIVTGARFDHVAVELIDPNPKQPREVFDEEALAELVTSIREVGVLQPVVVRESSDGRYELIMGERRLRASKQAGLEAVPAIIRETADDAMLRDALLENLHREQLNPLEEAAAYQQLLQEFGATHEELADRIGRSRSHVSNTLRLMNLTPPVQRRVAAGVLSAGHARALLALDRAEEQEKLAARIVAEGLSVRAAEEIVTAPSAPTTPRQRRAEPSAPGMETLARTLGDRLDTRVRIDFGRRRGRLTVEFATLDDLYRIVAVIAPDLTSGLSGSVDTPAEAAPGEEDAPVAVVGAADTDSAPAQQSPTEQPGQSHDEDSPSLGEQSGEGQSGESSDDGQGEPSSQPEDENHSGGGEHGGW